LPSLPQPHLSTNVVFMRGYTNTSSNKHTTLYWWNNVQDQASAATSSALDSLNFTADAYVADYYFTDGTNYYRTSQTGAGINEIRFGTSLRACSPTITSQRTAFPRPTRPTTTFGPTARVLLPQQFEQR
jgi:hypothetical protein